IGNISLNNRAEGEVANCFYPITPCLTVGTHSITASYPNGDNSFNAGGPSNAVSLTVTKGNPAIVFSGTPPTTVGYGQVFNVVLFVNPGHGTVVPTGTFQFFDGTAALGSPITASGNTAAQLSLTGQGTHTLTVKYSGDNT